MMRASSILLGFFLAVFVALIEAKNYYEILGIEKDTPQSEIKKVFRKLALKYHPDKNDEKNAEEKFREIVEGKLF
jgi:DnaJ-class molecular chaperone